VTSYLLPSNRRTLLLHIDLFGEKSPMTSGRGGSVGGVGREYRWDGAGGAPGPAWRMFLASSGWSSSLHKMRRTNQASKLHAQIAHTVPEWKPNPLPNRPLLAKTWKSHLPGTWTQPFFLWHGLDTTTGPIPCMGRQRRPKRKISMHLLHQISPDFILRPSYYLKRVVPVSLLSVWFWSQLSSSHNRYTKRR